MSGSVFSAQCWNPVLRDRLSETVDGWAGGWGWVGERGSSYTKQFDPTRYPTRRDTPNARRKGRNNPHTANLTCSIAAVGQHDDNKNRRRFNRNIKKTNYVGDMVTKTPHPYSLFPLTSLKSILKLKSYTWPSQIEWNIEKLYRTGSNQVHMYRERRKRFWMGKKKGL